MSGDLIYSSGDLRAVGAWGCCCLQFDGELVRLKTIQQPAAHVKIGLHLLSSSASTCP